MNQVKLYRDHNTPNRPGLEPGPIDAQPKRRLIPAQGRDGAIGGNYPITLSVFQDATKTL